MEKTLFTIVLLALLFAIVVALTTFNQLTFRANLFGDEEFMKYFIRFIALFVFSTSVLFISCLLNFPIIDKAWTLLQ
mgnify:CR=1 FL=1